MIITNGNGSVNGGSLQADSQPKSVGLMCRLTATWCSVLRYDTIRYEFNVDSKAECDQLNLAHETKTNNRHCQLSSVHVKDPWRQSGRNKKTMEERICERDEF